jgi:hypothetical protein
MVNRELQGHEETHELKMNLMLLIIPCKEERNANKFSNTGNLKFSEIRASDFEAHNRYQSISAHFHIRIQLMRVLPCAMPEVDNYDAARS